MAGAATEEGSAATGRHARPRRRAGRPRRGRRGHGDGQVPEDARGTPWPAGEQHDAVARVDVLLLEVPHPGQGAHRGVGAAEPGAGDVEAVEVADAAPVPLPPRRLGEVGDVPAGQRRAEAAVEAPELRAADQPAVPPRERHARDRGAGRLAGEDAADDAVGEDCVVRRAVGGWPLPLPRLWCARRRLLPLLGDDLILSSLLLHRSC